MFYPAEGNLPFGDGGWSGTVSLWVRLGAGAMPSTPLSYPFEISGKEGAGGRLCFALTDAPPRDLWLGVSPAGAAGEQIDPRSPGDFVVSVPKIGFQAGEWHHLACTWANFDSGQSNGWAALYVDGSLSGSISQRQLTMGWDPAKTGIYVGVDYVGLLDELAIFDRPLAADEIRRIGNEPGLLGKGR